jgi:hypothetical protein
MPPMPPRVAAIQRAIETRQDFSVLANGGEAEVFAWAKRHGMKGGVLICAWQENYRQRQAVGATSGRGDKKDAAMRSHDFDLDYWGDAPVDDREDDDDPEQQTTKTCPQCAGKGRDHSGDTCSRCGGSGRVPLDDFEEDDKHVEDEE